MNQKWDGIERRKSLRITAEAMVASLSPTEMTTKPAEMLLHELLVHKIELEMQNEELQRNHFAMAEARDRYRDLYDFAPAGYIVIDAAECIAEINLTGAALLGMERNPAINLRFSKCVADADRDRWYIQFRNLMDVNITGSLASILTMTRPDGAVFSAHLNCRRLDLGGAPVVLVLFSEMAQA